MNRLTGLIALGLVFGLLLPSATAQPRRRPQGPAALDEATQRAREAYDRGRTLFAAGQFQEALASFQVAYEAKPHPTVLVSIAECQERMEDFHAAVTTLERYLRDSPEARDRPQMEERIAAHRARPARLNVTSEPTGAAISVDGSDSGQTTPSELELAPGDHTIKVTLDGYQDATQDVTVEFAERRDLPMSLDAGGAEEVTDEPTDEPVEQTRSEGSTTPIWIAAGITGVGLVSGVVMGFLALSDRSDFDDDPTVETADRGERFALLADISFGVALVAGVTTVVLALTRDSSSAEPEEEGSDDPQALRLRLAPLAARNGGGIQAHLQF